MLRESNWKVVVVGLSASALLCLHGCGGGSGSSSSASGSSPTTTGAQGFDPGPDFDSLAAAFQSLPHVSPEGDATALLAAAKALPDVRVAALSDPVTVSITYKDGSSHIFVTRPINTPGDPLTPVPPVAASAATSMLAGRTALSYNADRASGPNVYIYSALTSKYTDQQLADPISTMAPWFKHQGYNVAPSPLSTPADLRNVKNATVLYLDTHGGIDVLEGGQTVFGIATALDAHDATNRAEYAKEIADHDVGYISLVAYLVLGTSKPELVATNFLFITPKFVRDNWTFTKNSLVFINGCGLMQNLPEAQAMVQTLLSAPVNATNVLGWDNETDATMAADSALYLFDRMLGGEMLAVPTDPKLTGYDDTPHQRPFSLEAMLLDMRTRPHQPAAQVLKGTTYTLSQSFSATPFVTANLALKFAPSANAFALAPSISGLALKNDSDTLILTGDFGGDAQNKSVTINGEAVPVTSWTSGLITVSPLPQTGSGAAGLVKVSMNGAVSNTPLINQWSDVQFTMVTQNGPAVQRTVTCVVNLRASFDTIRAEPSGIPANGAVSVDDPVVQNGQCQFVATGPGAESGTLPWINPTAGGTIGNDGARIWGLTTTDGNLGGTMSLSMEGFHSDNQLSFDDTTATSIGAQPVVAGADNSIAAGTASQSNDTMNWLAAQPVFAPNEKNPR